MYMAFLTRKMFFNRMNAVLTMIKLSGSDYKCSIKYKLDSSASNDYSFSNARHELRDHRYDKKHYDIVLQVSCMNYAINFRDSFSESSLRKKSIELKVGSLVQDRISDGMLQILSKHFKMKIFSKDEFIIDYYNKTIELKSSYYKIYKCFVALIKELDKNKGMKQIDE